ncbi:MAG TPA: cytochrome c oxidase assembly protein [Gammaproteobacteria bacterium]
MNTVPAPANNRLVAKLLLVVLAMFGFGYALVPLYDIICDITGLNGKTGQVSAAEVVGPDESRTVTVKFVATVNNAAPWEFLPNDVTMKVHPGGIYTTSYRARNKTGRSLVGQATPSVSPREASLYFNKTECFCFTKQEFEPHEDRDMPVKFVVDRDLPSHIESLVLSYTFFDITDSSGKS